VTKNSLYHFGVNTELIEVRCQSTPESVPPSHSTPAFSSVGLITFCVIRSMSVGLPTLSQNRSTKSETVIPPVGLFAPKFSGRRNFSQLAYGFGWSAWGSFDELVGQLHKNNSPVTLIDGFPVPYMPRPVLVIDVASLMVVGDHCFSFDTLLTNPLFETTIHLRSHSFESGLSQANLMYFPNL
jgi:hypothetical protein